MLLSVMGIYYEPLAWQYQEYLEIGAALGLIAGIGLGARMLVLSLRRRREAEARYQRLDAVLAEIAEPDERTPPTKEHAS